MIPFLSESDESEVNRAAGNAWKTLHLRINSIRNRLGGGSAMITEKMDSGFAHLAIEPASSSFR